MSDILHDLSPPALAGAIEANQFELFLLWRHWPPAEVHDDPEMLWTITDIPVPMFNSVLRAQIAPDTADDAIEAAIARCRERNVPLHWMTGPSTRPADLVAHLEAHGFIGEDQPGMAVDLLALNEDLLTPPGVTIEQVSDDEALVHWCHATVVGFGFPEIQAGAWLDLIARIRMAAPASLRLYLARSKGEPVATALEFLGAGVAGIYAVATIPEARRQGIGTAITLAPLREARELGYRVGTLDATEMGEGVYRRIGFREYCRIGHYEWRGEGERSQKELGRIAHEGGARPLPGVRSGPLPASRRIPPESQGFLARSGANCCRAGVTPITCLGSNSHAIREQPGSAHSL
jgi:GNAT superfamily N-acetyltransferase